MYSNQPYTYPYTHTYPPTGVQMKPLMESQFTNIGIVAALMLTILVAALQADIPDSGDPSSIIWVWYIILLGLGLYFRYISMS
jgi:hypothetical protein